jgi:hypothetical protein
MPVIDWSTAEVYENGDLMVTFAGPREPGLRVNAGQDEFWGRAFESLVQSHASQARGHTWGPIEMVRGAIIVRSVPEGEEPALRQYLAELVEGADRNALKLREDSELAQKQAAEDEQERLARAGRMQSRFRDG